MAVSTPTRIFGEDNCEFREFSDIVHTIIRLPPVLCSLIDTAQFHRLKHVAQLGMVDYVWPCASHCRKEHSIGVAYLAGKFLDALRTKHRDPEITDVDKLCVMIAGLCHDMGHGPFSHTFEVFVNTVRPDRNWRHEDTSVDMFEYMLKQNPGLQRQLEDLGLTETDFTFIKECIVGPNPESKDVYRQKWPYKGRGKDKGFLYDIISNKHGGLDVDRLDYLLRDSAYLGVGTSFQVSSLKRIFGNARICTLEDETKRICYATHKITSDLESVGRTRYRLHEIAYNHKTAKSCELMLCDIFRLAGDLITFYGDDKEMYKLADCMGNMGAYQQLNDHVLTWIKIEGIRAPHRAVAGPDDAALLAALNLIERLETRNLYPTVDSLNVQKVLWNHLKSVDPREEIVEKINDELGEEREPFRTEELRYFISNKNFGSGEQYPLVNVMSYNHKDLTEPPKLIEEERLPADLPKKVNVFTLTLYSCQKEEDSVVKKLRTGFRKWHQEKTCQLDTKAKDPEGSARRSQKTPKKKLIFP